MAKIEIEIEGGKYTLILDQGRLTALRYGEPWRDVTGDSLVYWMMCEIRELQDQLAQFVAPPLEPPIKFQKRTCILYTLDGEIEAVAEPATEDWAGRQVIPIKSMCGQYEIQVEKGWAESKFDRSDKPTFYAC